MKNTLEKIYIQIYRFSSKILHNGILHAGVHLLIPVHVHFSSNLYITLLITYVYHIFDLCIQKHIQDTFHLRCDICPPDNSEDIVWNNSLRKTLVLGNLINVKLDQD